MRDTIASANRKLDDLLMLGWAIGYYNNLPQSAHENRSRIEVTWFHDLFIAQLIERDETETLSRLFHSLPAQHFSTLTPLIIKRWPHWPSTLANAATRILAVNAPYEILDLFETYLQQIEKGALPDIERLQSIHLLATIATEESCRSFLIRLYQRFLTLPEDDFSRMISLPTLLEMSGTLSLDTLRSLLDAALRSDESVNRREGVLKALFQGLFGHIEYLDLVFARDKKESEQCLEVLSPFFLPEAPLVQFDQWLESPPAFYTVVPILEELCCRSGCCKKILELLQDSKIGKSLPDITRSQLGIAACIHGFARETFDDLTLDLEATVNLLSADLAEPRWFYTLFEHLHTFDRQDIVTALVSRLPSIQYTYGAVQLAKAMGELGWPEFVPSLIESIGEDQKDFLCEASQSALIEIGNPSQATLIERWDDLDQSQRIFGLSVIRHVGGTAAADFACAHFVALMEDNVEFCCELALAIPDQRLLDRLQPELRRKQPLIDRAYYIIARLLDRDDEAMQAAKSRAIEDENRRAKLMEAFNSGNFSRESLSLELRCPSCGAVNRYEVKGVIVAKEQDTGVTHLINDEFPCASCEQYVEFEFTAMALMALTAEMLLITAAHESGQKRDSLITFVDCQLDGQSIPIAAGLGKLRDLVAKTPTDARVWFQLGRLLAYINRPKAAIQALSQAAKIAPDAVDVKLALAELLAANNANEEAFKILSDALDRLPSWQFLAAYPNFGQVFAQVYNHLRRSLDRNDLPALHPSSLAALKKIGRNDPCPCGSGKKFKKCCDR
jgi:tetratricopeptide (TPR) repeat protein